MSGSKFVVSLNPRPLAIVGTPGELADRAQRAQRRADRELAARHEAERLLESKSLELFAANQRLTWLNAGLEARVEDRTKELDNARRAAIRIGETDHLTGIPNRLRYSAHLEQSLMRSQAGDCATGLLLVDLDGFKTINDTLGHQHGDRLLIEIAKRLKGVNTSNDLVARIGGDEFAVVIQGADARSIALAAEQFRGIFGRPVTFDGVSVRPRGSFGLAICPEHCGGVADVQRYADLALYKSKSQGKGEVVVFEQAFLSAYEYRQRIEAEFRIALEGGAINLAYQPIVRIETGKIEAVEALARWTDSNGVEISPAYFIPLAEQCGIIQGVGRSLLEKALLETKDWIDQGFIEHVSFNVSPLELVDECFADAVLATLAKVGVEPRHLLLEITEGVVIHSIALIQTIMTRLQKRGVKFALDDFGCGYSDLSTLRKLPIYVLKIDRSLLTDAETDEAARIILRNVVSLCRELRIRSVCEGAETAAQLEILRTVGCDLVQGFVSGRPGPVSKIATILRSSGRSNRSTPHGHPSE